MSAANAVSSGGGTTARELRAATASATQCLIEEHRAAYACLIARFSAQLNALHGEARSPRYWEILVGPWCHYFLRLVAHRWFNLGQLRASPAPPIPVAYDYASMIFALDEADYERSIALNLDRPAGAVQFTLLRLGHKHGSLAARLRRRALAVISTVTSTRAPIVMVSPYLTARDTLHAVWLGKGRILPAFIDESTAEIMTVDPSAREWRVPPPRDLSEFERALHAAAVRALPMVHVEAYPSLLERACRLAPSARVLFSTLGWHQHELFKLVAALRAEEGARLVGHQHGGLYGIGLGAITDYEAEVCDTYLTWGWRGPRSSLPFGGVRAFRTRRAVQQARSRGVNPADILYATTSGSPHAPNGLGCPSGIEFRRYFEWCHTFLASLDGDSFRETVARPYPGDYLYCWGQKATLARRFPTLRFSAENEFEAALSRAKLFVSDNNFTTYLEAHAADVPTMLFFDPSTWPIHPRAAPFFDELEKVGLYHPTPESAAAFVGHIRENPRAWWDSPRVRGVRSRFAHSFASAPADLLPRLVEILADEEMKSMKEGVS